MNPTVGIDRLHLYIPPQYIDMVDLAEARGIDPNKFIIGIGQDQMAVTDAKQDIVSMAINAAYPILSEEDKGLIDQVIVATESAFDYSKAVSIYLHEALEINPFAKCYEIKEACYSGTAALLSAVDYVRLNPDRKVLVVTTDIARYGLATPGEATQGAGAIAILVASNPAIFAIGSERLAFTDNQFDFWRPYYEVYPRVEGKFSTELYNQTFIRVMEEAIARYPQITQEIKTQIFHLPFTKMGRKAMKAYRDYLEEAVSSCQEKILALDRWQDHYDQSTLLSRRVGNIYTGSLYLGLLSLLINAEDLVADDQIGLFSYGSGAVAEFFYGQLQPEFRSALLIDQIQNRFDQRRRVTVDEYEAIYQEELTQADEKIEYKSTVMPGDFYLSKIDHHRRFYRRHQ